jgi:hypothetical protein
MLTLEWEPPADPAIHKFRMERSCINFVIELPPPSKLIQLLVAIKQ